MKNILPLLFGLAVLASACGSTAEEKEVEQVQAEEKIDDKVNEIMDELEAAGEEAEIVADSASMEGHEGHDHGDHEGHSH